MVGQKIEFLTISSLYVSSQRPLKIEAYKQRMLLFDSFSGPWTTPPGISWAYGEICVLLTHLFYIIFAVLLKFVGKRRMTN